MHKSECPFLRGAVEQAGLRQPYTILGSHETYRGQRRLELVRVATPSLPGRTARVLVDWTTGEVSMERKVTTLQQVRALLFRRSAPLPLRRDGDSGPEIGRLWQGATFLRWHQVAEALHGWHGEPELEAQGSQVLLQPDQRAILTYSVGDVFLEVYDSAAAFHFACQAMGATRGAA